MKLQYENNYNSERSVEIAFVVEALSNYAPNKKLLDVGGIPTDSSNYNLIYKCIKDLNVTYKVADFRGGDYTGDFVTKNIDETFDIVLFLSTIEHFPQCTEGDRIFREGEDRKGFLKALQILNKGGIIIITVPFGFHKWQPYHQNYNLAGILKLSEGSTLIEKYVYRLIDNKWVLYDPEKMEDVFYTDKAYGVGCFLFKK